MLCEQCNEREATVHLTQVVEGSVKKVHLCEECAAKSGLDLNGPMTISDIFLGMGGVEAGGKGGVERSCPRCHLRQADFKKTGRLGCPDCYETFSEELGALIKAMHRSEQHVGKVPSQESPDVGVKERVAALQQALEEAVAAENYEEAARLRDEIRSLKPGEAGGGEGA